MPLWKHFLYIRVTYLDSIETAAIAPLKNFKSKYCGNKIYRKQLLNSTYERMESFSSTRVIGDFGEEQNKRNKAKQWGWKKFWDEVLNTESKRENEWWMSKLKRGEEKRWDGGRGGGRQHKVPWLPRGIVQNWWRGWETSHTHTQSTWDSNLRPLSMLLPL